MVLISYLVVLQYSVDNLGELTDVIKNAAVPFAELPGLCPPVLRSSWVELEKSELPRKQVRTMRTWYWETALLYEINVACNWWQITALSRKHPLNWFIQNSWFVMNKQEWPLNHWTDSFKSLDLFSLQCVDARNSSCGLSGTVDSSAAKITKYRVINLKTHTRVILTPHFRFLVQEKYQLLDKTLLQFRGKLATASEIKVWRRYLQSRD